MKKEASAVRDVRQLFAVRQPLHIDVGCGHGEFLMRMAADNPNVNFVGIEYSRKRALQSANKIAKRGITNVRVVQEEAVRFLWRAVWSGTVSSFYINFPDPWPKGRHAKRRLLNSSFVQLLFDLLVPDGVVTCATDVSWYAETAFDLFAKSGLFESAFDDGLRRDPPPDYPRTLYQRKAEERGVGSFFMRFRKLGPSPTQKNEIVPLIGAQNIANRVVEMGKRITADYAGAPLIVVPVLGGGIVFFADLVRRIDLPICVVPVRARSYGWNTKSSGVVNIQVVGDLGIVRGTHVLIVDDILDTGRTLHDLVDLFHRTGAASIRAAVLLDKPERREVSVSADYVGFEIPNVFVVGYGLDYKERYRNLPYIGYLRSPGRGLENPELQVSCYV